ncbi:MAG: RluA family pseudouridine synthase [Bdellovibrionales bacterium]|nr:RluA family pseudouridine synthase [Bdellovibrionales bacterium]
MDQPKIIHETSDFWIIDKPANWLSRTGRDGADGAPNPFPIVAEWLFQNRLKNPGEKVFIVHRLDLQTSGVMVYAKTAEMHRKLSMLFEKHQIKKVYEFIAGGNPTQPVYRCSEPIEGSKALTQIEVLTRFRNPFYEAFIGRARIETGRRHQIRIHLKGIGHPILGDVRYGGFENLAYSPPGEPPIQLKISRVALHAAELSIPGIGNFRAEKHADFKDWISWMQNHPPDQKAIHQYRGST